MHMRVHVVFSFRSGPWLKPPRLSWTGVCTGNRRCREPKTSQAAREPGLLREEGTPAGQAAPPPPPCRWG